MIIAVSGLIDICSDLSPNLKVPKAGFRSGLIRSHDIYPWMYDPRELDPKRKLCSVKLYGEPGLPVISSLGLPLARQLNCGLLNCSSASIFKVLQCRSKLVGVSSRSKLFAYDVLFVLGWLRVYKEIRVEWCSVNFCLSVKIENYRKQKYLWTFSWNRRIPSISGRHYDDR